MKSKSHSLVKALILLSTAIAGASGYWAHGAYAENARMRAGNERAVSDLAASRSHLSDLQAKLVASPTPPLDISTVMSRVSLALYNGQTPFGFSISTMTPKRQAGGATAAAVTELADKVPGTPLQAVRIELRGSFERLDGLKDFVQGLQAQYPVSVDQLKIERNQFEVSLLVLGV